MKKYFNKALLYQWFNSAKGVIILGLLIWLFCANSILKDIYNTVMNNISTLINNDFITIGLDKYIILESIFVGIYFMISGSSKQNVNMFLASGPYTKKQIKYNQLICFLITLLMFVLEYIYVAIIFYIRHKERFSIINGYSFIIVVEVVKIILFGIIGIIIMMIIDSMFCNNRVCAIFMLIMPILLLFPIIKTFVFYKNLWINNVMQKDFFSEKIHNFQYKALIDKSINASDIKIIDLLNETIIFSIFIIFLFILLKIVQTKNSLETNINFFASTWSKKVILGYLSLVLAMIISGYLLGEFQNSIIWKNGELSNISIIDFYMMLGADIVSSTIFAIVIYIITKKIFNQIFIKA